MSTTLHGTWFVVPTAFTDEHRIDLDAQRRLVDTVIGWGVDGLTVMGVMSEVALLTPAERRALLEAMLDEVAGRVPVVVGCVAGGDVAAAELAVEAAELGAVAAMVAPPPMTSNIDGIPAFFASVAERSRTPIVLQDEPRAYGVVMSPRVIAAACEASGAAAIKLEDPPTPEKIGRLLELVSDVPVFGGLGGVSALWELRRGASGTMTGFAFPEILAAVRLAHERGDADEAGRVFNRFLPLIQFEAQTGIGLAIRKEVLRRRGALAGAASRLHPRGIDPRAAQELDDVLRWVGLEPSSARLRIEEGGVA
ncbi:MAG TPA: dihydrodipicolinate synthase family protein [Gaiellaceae bacterium]|nr:dihydrodipicolinate synthase family protein [Gaiellaceae bacterium]